MIKYLPLLFLIACNSEMQKETASKINPNAGIQDSLNVALDSLKTDLTSLIAVADYAKDAQSKIKRLEAERDNFILTKGERKTVYDTSVSVNALQYAPVDNYYLNKLREYEREISRLKKKIYTDSVYYARTDKVVPNVIEYEPLKPNDKSLIINLDKKIKGDGEIAETGVSVYIFPYDKKAKKLKKYEIFCNPKDVQDAKQADYYKGQYFFNDVKPGKYLIKVCAYYGNYVVIKREDRLQTIQIQMSPPIQ
jgi:hypothetical protein